jgi:hypothetical protein
MAKESICLKCKNGFKITKDRIGCDIGAYPSIKKQKCKYFQDKEL